MDLHDFQDSVDRASDATARVMAIDRAVQTVCNELPNLLPSQIDRLVKILAPYFAAEPSYSHYDEKFDLNYELSEQIGAVRAMRSRVYLANGKVDPEIPMRELKETITASTTMFNSLMRHHAAVQSMERRRAVEAATIDTLKECDPALADKFMENFRQKLEVIT